MGKFCKVFGDHQLDELAVDDIMDFLNQLTDGCKPLTKRIRYAHLSAFFPTMPGIIRARPMQTALQYGAPKARALKTWSSAENPPAKAISGTHNPLLARRSHNSYAMECK